MWWPSTPNGTLLEDWFQPGSYLVWITIIQQRQIHQWWFTLQGILYPIVCNWLFFFCSPHPLFLGVIAKWNEGVLFYRLCIPPPHRPIEHLIIRALRVVLITVTQGNLFLSSSSCFDFSVVSGGSDQPILNRLLPLLVHLVCEGATSFISNFPTEQSSGSGDVGNNAPANRHRGEDTVKESFHLISVKWYATNQFKKELHLTSAAEAIEAMTAAWIQKQWMCPIHRPRDANDDCIGISLETRGVAWNSKRRRECRQYGVHLWGSKAVTQRETEPQPGPMFLSSTVYLVHFALYLLRGPLEEDKKTWSLTTTASGPAWDTHVAVHQMFASGQRQLPVV